MRQNIILTIMIMIGASGIGWGQKAVNSADILLAPGWKQIYDAYIPDAQLIEKLKIKAPELKVDIYFGYWCDDSKNNLPVFLKILDTLNMPEFKVNFYEVEKKSTAVQKYYVEDMRVEKVPTFIFYINDFEMGRIIENPRDTILQDMMLIVF
ncbi:MAG: thioredoxin family protein [Chrysiogenales bacterium]